MSNRGMWQRIRSFALPPLVSTLVSLAFLPILARAVTEGEWVALAVGQSVGTVAAIAINFGWTLTGPAAVAALDDEGRRHVYVRSLQSQAVALVVLAPVACLVTVAVAPGQHGLLAAAMTLAMTVAGVAPTWFNIGVGSAGNVILYDVLPRTAATAVALVAVLAGTGVVVYPALLGVSSLLATLLFLRRTRPRRPDGGPSVLPLGATLRRQVGPALTEFAGGSYSSASLTLVASQATVAATADYTSGARLYAVSLLSITIISQAFQGWVNERGASVMARLRQALLVHAVLGVAGLVGLGLLGSWASRILFGERLAMSPGVALGLGLSFLFVAVNTAMGRHILVVTHQTTAILTGTLLGAGVGVPLTLVLAHTHGAAGGAWALAVSELVVLGALAVPCRRGLRLLREQGAPEGGAAVVPGPPPL